MMEEMRSKALEYAWCYPCLYFRMKVQYKQTNTYPNAYFSFYCMVNGKQKRLKGCWCRCHKFIKNKGKVKILKELSNRMIIINTLNKKPAGFTEIREMTGMKGKDLYRMLKSIGVKYKGERGQRLYYLDKSK